MNVTLTILCATCALPLAAQTGGDTRQKPAAGGVAVAQAEKPAFVSLDHMLGTKVYVTGAGGATPLDDATKLEVEDLVVDASSGEAVALLLEHDDRSAAVPVSMIKCTRPPDDPEGEPILQLPYDAAKLKGLPTFDLSAAREKGFDSAVLVLESSWSAVGIPAEASSPKAKDAAPKEAVVVTGTTFMSLPVRFVLASKLDGIDVYARTEDFGDVEDLLFDTGSHRLAYAVVASGGVLGMGEEKYLVPFRALCVGYPTEDKDKKVLVIDMPKEGLAVEAARYQKPEKGAALSKERAEQYDKFFEPAIKAKASRKE